MVTSEKISASLLLKRIKDLERRKGSRSSQKGEEVIERLKRNNLLK